MKARWVFIALLGTLLWPLTIATAETKADPEASKETVAANTANVPPSDQGSGQPALRQRHPRYQIQSGDVLDITFAFTPEYNRTATVQPDGFINLRDLPDMHVVGKTTPELTESIRRAYARILHDPVITVELKDFEKPYFIAGGQIGKPGKYDLRGETTVVQAIAIAGGFNETSKHSQVLLFRRFNSEWVEAKVLDLKQMLKTADLREDLYLRPGDMIYVPKNTFSKISPFIPRASMGLYFNPLY